MGKQNDGLAVDGAIAQPLRLDEARGLHAKSRLPANLAAHPPSHETAKGHVDPRDIPQGDRIVRFDGEGFLVARQGFVRPQHVGEQMRLVVQREQEIGPNRERSIITRQRLLEPVKLMHDAAKVIVGVWVGRIELRRSRPVGERLLQPAQFLKHQRAHMQRVGLVRIGVHRDVEKRQRLGEAVLSVEDQAAQICRVRIMRAQVEGVPQAQQGLVRAIQLDQHGPEILPMRRVGRLKRYRLVERLQRP